jgi:hypothetical protein
MCYAEVCMFLLLLLLLNPFDSDVTWFCHRCRNRERGTQWKRIIIGSKRPRRRKSRDVRCVFEKSNLCCRKRKSIINRTGNKWYDFVSHSFSISRELLSSVCTEMEHLSWISALSVSHLLVLSLSFFSDVSFLISVTS